MLGASTHPTLAGVVGTTALGEEFNEMVGRARSLLAILAD